MQKFVLNLLLYTMVGVTRAIELFAPLFLCPPSPRGACSVKCSQSELVVMALVELQQTRMANFLPYEIECPRCTETMTLLLEFNSPFYSCEECDFILDPCKKN